MKSFSIDRYGGPEVLREGDLPTPEVRPDDILIAVHAAGVNPVDYKIREGQLKVLIKYRFPTALGNEVSGVVARVGANVTRFKEGDAVFARLAKERIGGFAELAVVPAAFAAHKPKNLTHAEAASIPLVALTSWQAMVEIGQLQRGQKVLIHAGSGGVGTFAIQLAKHLGANVVTTASAQNAALLRQLGADTVIDYKTQRFEEVVSDCDLVFDTQGHDTLVRSFACVKRGGVVVTVSGKPDAKFAKAWGLNPILVMVLRFLSRKVTKLAREKDVRFEYLFMRPDGEQLAKVGELLSNGTIKPIVDSTFPFERTKDALARVESGRAVGKVVIVNG